MVVRGYASALVGVEATTVTVESSSMSYHGEGGITYIIGLPDHSIRESLFRCEAAIKHSGFEPIRQRQIINLSPADLKKEGSAYDLPIAIVMLAMSFQIGEQALKDFIIMGELSLDGKVQPIQGALSMAILAKKQGFKGVILPFQNATEAAIIDEIEVYGVNNLCEAANFLAGRIHLERSKQSETNQLLNTAEKFELDFKDINGQNHAKRALEIACAGGHNAILIGPPGAGKTMLAKRIPGILPPMSLEEAVETTKIYSVAGKLNNHNGLIIHRTFRSPHHSISNAALIGGGSNPQPGEISLAHNGVLFLDELPEFNRNVLETLRQPLEENYISIARSKYHVEYPANVMLIASMNPCKCGYYNHPKKNCSCLPGSISRYMSKISGPLMDRIDLQIQICPVEYDEMSNKNQSAESSETIRQRVVNSREIQIKRNLSLGLLQCRNNAEMPSNKLNEICTLNATAQGLLKTAMFRLQLSGRSYDRILRISRTIADLDNSINIETHHLAEAIQYRSLDRDNWGK